MEIMVQKAHTNPPQGSLFLQRVSQHTKHVHCHTFVLIVLLSHFLECKAEDTCTVWSGLAWGPSFLTVGVTVLPKEARKPSILRQQQQQQQHGLCF